MSTEVQPVLYFVRGHEGTGRTRARFKKPGFPGVPAHCCQLLRYLTVSIRMQRHGPRCSNTASSEPEALVRGHGGVLGRNNHLKGSGGRLDYIRAASGKALWDQSATYAAITWRAGGCSDQCWSVLVIRYEHRSLLSNMRYGHDKSRYGLPFLIKVWP